ncbi:2,5-diamino-6-(ribosylamino)-4(3H)-pyrimidinone 5'-phosphate reductase [Methanosarcina thermophila]|jgi:2,5-diamino-6-(ribosylamino)-4(3H)-pyrimidinone 5'-phosphate reductase|uniref:Diaminohydroxyphosphoribosylaminopyrimidine deaminase n=3 Tax=Methanosarcina thermophila TaxID=2210 RepID=A0A0E3NDL3_METTE|nr:RibD family protein [Methanosarcina thermophila]ALK04806.1 MAG: 5-amino-6-(5-phosphoribosylamino)uracil reductase [Methanosarcina sp. 795]AKB13518.1 Diaminohydroxyphosphoribosylaminopyrimidine deaminase [Methanosarcina thermophila TM-1]AKB15849.1 Diaminohydroxyphosphoribosylaminopyrimidine deaminase [Methanosarcina thermophila CHTI-55]NLU56593.1 RibD family protein [Methanosarcina thermophila]SFT32075.1 2,5-diamino-6-(ribosylamino)-4(3H)-pyrimidinone 5'-phosphate reductase [Methanosarcina t
MIPKLIVHNSISLDGSTTGFEANLDIHYKLLSSYLPDAIIVGSNTAKTGTQFFCETIPPEEESDFRKPEIQPDDPRAYWLIADSRGILEGLLHVFRRSDYGKDVIVLVSEKTPEGYINYLKERNYDFIRAGADRVNIRHALEIANERYGFELIASDSGGVLNSILLEHGLVEEISLIINPVIVGKNGTNLFRTLEKSDIRLELLKNQIVEKQCVHLVYRVLKE